MRAYGDKKTSGTKVAGHQDCGICHPPIKNKKKKARKEAKNNKRFLGPCQGCGGISLCVCNDS